MFFFCCVCSGRVTPGHVAMWHWCRTAGAPCLERVSVARFVSVSLVDWNLISELQEAAITLLPTLATGRMVIQCSSVHWTLASACNCSNAYWSVFAESPPPIIFLHFFFAFCPFIFDPYAPQHFWMERWISSVRQLKFVGKVLIMLSNTLHRMLCRKPVRAAKMLTMMMARTFHSMFGAKRI